MEDNTKEKPYLSYNDKGFVLNYSVTRNEEIAFVDYESETITFKQMPLPIDKIEEIIKYFKSSKGDHNKYLYKEQKNESDNSEGPK